MNMWQVKWDWQYHNSAAVLSCLLNENPAIRRKGAGLDSVRLSIVRVIRSALADLKRISDPIDVLARLEVSISA